MATTLTDPNIAADLSRMRAITPFVNTPRYRTRPELYAKFKDMMAKSGVDLITVEIAFGNRAFEVTSKNNPHHVQLRSIEELWHKENMINIAIEYIMQVWPDTREVAWIDGDCFPLAIDPHEWLSETWHQLQHYEIVQMWEYLINFGPDGQPISLPQMGFMKTYAANGYTVPKGKNVKHTLAGHSGMVSLGRPGLAWAANVEALNKIGGLLDICILGSGDWHMAHALVGAMNQGKYSQETLKLSEYNKALLHFQELCERWIKRDVGYVPVTLGHHFHGDKKDRRYGERGLILIENQYNPKTDIKKDAQGLWQLETWEPRQIRLRDLFRDYFKRRNEDSVPLR
jgi:hypothetical protein